MPIYLFKNPDSGKIVHVIQRMSEAHVYSENGVQFERVFTIPNTYIDENIDTSQKFVEKTGSMKGTLGEIWDYSQELSEKRAKSNGGVDPIRKKAEDKYSKKRRGMKYKSQINPSEIPKIQLD
jgi:hypothetical protein